MFLLITCRPESVTQCAGNDLNQNFETLIGSLVEGEIGICDNFLPPALALQLQKNLLALEHSNKLRLAGIGNDAVKDPNQQKRGDRIFWIDNESTEPAEAGFFRLIAEFIVYLNESCYAGINACEFHYALYETGSSYKRHVDQFHRNSDRKFSLVSYLNTDWLYTDGGELCIYQPGHIERILPHMEKTVLFRSDRCEHEVLEASRPRMSITGWLKSV